MIGIKIADGTFYPILEESEKKKKKVILTTVKDDQATVQIDLYRGADAGMANPEYLGSMTIDRISPAPGGEPEIELLMSIDDSDSLITKARDLRGDHERSLAVNLENLPREKTYDIPDFEIESGPEDSYGTPYFPPLDSADREEARKSGSLKPLLVIAAAAVLVAGLALAFFHLLPRLRGGDEAVTATAPATPVAETPKPVPPEISPAEAARPAPPKQEPIVGKPQSIGVYYSTVKGDNLWNLSRSFYDDPWLYRKIAEANGIRNPNLIRRNHRLYIPDVHTEKR